MKKAVLIIIIIFLCFSLFLFFDDKDEKNNEEDFFSNFMKSETDENFLKAVEKREFKFPEDHGIHKGFQTEWWYFTGNLKSVNNKRFGYQFTLFRSQLNPEKTEKDSLFSSNALYMAHLAVTDADSKKFYYFEKFARENPNNAYVKQQPFKAEIDGWKFYETDNEQGKLENLKLEAKKENISLDLNLKITKPFVLQGDEGLSQKSKGKGNASYYYSATRINTKGSINIKENEYKVEGSSWLDREWSTSALSEEQEGWDWFAIHLNDNTEIMFYNLRLKSKKRDKLSKGVYVYTDGNYEKIEANELVLETKDKWKSPKGGVYPSGWVMKIPEHNIRLDITPLIKNQELDFFIRYWEGAVNVSGTKDGKKIEGSGYVELTGYADNK
ncbi:MAG: lipocalin-like domain-containing protein [Thermodesulfobacteriota bacterium]